MKFDIVTRLRQNHALEHATIACLRRKIKPQTMVFGRATTDGFCLYSDAPNEVVSQAAQEGLARLKQGESNLAISPRCGTNLATTALLAALASTAALKGSTRPNRVPNLLMLTMAAIIVAQPLGSLAQRFLTTSADLGSVDIAEVSSKGEGRWSRHRVKTLRS
jgi:hypothetical protein